MNQDYARRFAIQLAVGAALVSFLPFLIALALAPDGARYAGVQYNLDDHMVYAAWMRQAMDGAFLFDNRFAIDPQPGLTIHVYFLVLGWVAKLIGIPLAGAVARSAFTSLAVWLLYRLISKISTDVYVNKLALTLCVFGAGAGFLVWQNFGVAISEPAPAFLSRLMSGLLPTDVWQPEGFFFSSMVTSGLFMVSLSLILFIFICALEARESSKPVLPGALGFLLLMNIHSYDVLLVTVALLGMAAMALKRGKASPQWAGRVVLMGLGAVPAALWFVYVLRNDPVFQARAATETFSPNFRQILFGYLGLIVLGFIGPLTASERIRKLAGGGLALLILVMYFAAEGHTSGFWMGTLPFLLSFAAVLVGVIFVARDNPAWNLVGAWAFMGLVIPYFPALFQRKLLMGLGIPWAILAALGIAALLKNVERGPRNLATVLALIVLSASSLRWFVREISLATRNLSNTTVHAVYLGKDVQAAVDYLNKQPGRKVVLAMPGIPPLNLANPTLPAYLPDMNPVLSGFTGAYSYAGHWSETPSYNQRRTEATRFFLGDTDPATRTRLLAEAKIDYIFAPNPEAYQDFAQLTGKPLANLAELGQVVVNGTQFQLIKVRSDSN
ncbi:MAG TPA: hypothetical protein VEX38_06895 [Fimbriimonadaceae bacterium]|nr:hypothetical protein [Fimbriimonadaceae bacterium]